jgi:hemolysin activation/secretion protein
MPVLTLKSVGRENRLGKNRTLTGPVIFFSALLIFANSVSIAISAYGQNLPTLDFGERSGESRPELLEKRTLTPPPVITLPPPAPQKGSSGALIKSVFVRKIDVQGSSVFTAEEIAGVTAPFEGRYVTMEDLEALRYNLTLLYVNRGYINSGAIIPDQPVVDGLITFRIVEGKLTSINLTGNKWFAESFLRDRIALGAEAPVNILHLQDRLQLLQQDRRIKLIHAELRPAARPGESELEVKVEETPPFSVEMRVNNYQSPVVGAEEGLVTLAHQNLSGHGDVLSFTYGYSEGLHPEIDTWYAAPVNAHDTTLLVRYRYNDSKVVDKVFGPLDIVSKTESYELTVRQPVYRTLSQEVALSFSAEYEENKTYLLGERFSFSPGADNGRTKVIPVRFAQEWTYRTQRQVIAARSRFSVGVDAFDATTNTGHNTPDGQFFAWLGQLQGARILDFLDMQLLARADVQLSNNSLLPVEQIGMGGRYSVRGYRENLFVRDQAFIASIESRVPLIQNKQWADYLQICQFLDYGRSTNVDIPTVGPKEISSVGLGLRWAAIPIKSPFEVKAEAEAYWGYRLKRFDLPDDEDIQDDGIHFQFAVTCFF